MVVFVSVSLSVWVSLSLSLFLSLSLSQALPPFLSLFRILAGESAHLGKCDALLVVGDPERNKARRRHEEWYGNIHDVVFAHGLPPVLEKGHAMQDDAWLARAA